MAAGIRPSLTEGRKSSVFHEGQPRIPEGAGPDVKNMSGSLTADVEVKAYTNGMFITHGLFAGCAVTVIVLHHLYCAWAGLPYALPSRSGTAAPSLGGADLMALYCAADGTMVGSPSFHRSSAF
jgi:hypothetical protein